MDTVQVHRTRALPPPPPLTRVLPYEHQLTHKAWASPRYEHHQHERQDAQVHEPEAELTTHQAVGSKQALRHKRLSPVQHRAHDAVAWAYLDVVAPTLCTLLTLAQVRIQVCREVGVQVKFLAPRSMPGPCKQHPSGKRGA